jgi:hypothetical protein
VDERVQTIVNEALENGLALYEKRYLKAKGLIQASAVVLRNADAAILVAFRAAPLSRKTDPHPFVHSSESSGRALSRVRRYKILGTFPLRVMTNFWLDFQVTLMFAYAFLAAPSRKMRLDV